MRLSKCEANVAPTPRAAAGRGGVAAGRVHCGGGAGRRFGRGGGVRLLAANTVPHTQYLGPERDRGRGACP